MGYLKGILEVTLNLLVGLAKDFKVKEYLGIIYEAI